jgi:hypothetical protein
MKSIMLVMIMLTSSLVYGQREPVRPGSRGDTGGRSLPKGPEAEATGAEAKRPAPKKPPVEIAELVFKRMDSNHDGSISLKEFKVAFPRLRQSFTRSSSQGRTRGASGFRPPEKGARPKGSPPSRGKSYRGSSRGRSRGGK